MTHILVVGLRMGLLRIELPDKRRAAAGLVAAILFVWTIIVMATSEGNQIGAGFGQFFCTLILGSILVEAAYRLFLHFKASEQRRLMSRAAPQGTDSEDLQYAAL